MSRVPGMLHCNSYWLGELYPNIRFSISFFIWKYLWQNSSTILPIFQYAIIRICKYIQIHELNMRILKNVNMWWIYDMWIYGDHANMWIWRYVNIWQLCKYVNIWICTYANVGLWEYVNISIGEYAVNMRIFGEYVNIHWICKYAKMQICNYSYIPICEYVNVRDMQICKYIRNYKHANMWICGKYANMERCII